MKCLANAGRNRSDGSDARADTKQVNLGRSTRAEEALVVAPGRRKRAASVHPTIVMSVLKTPRDTPMNRDVIEGGRRLSQSSSIFVLHLVYKWSLDEILLAAND